MPTSSSSPPTPLSLLERLRQPGDADAWDRFARLYTPLLYFWARKTNLQESDAADLVQEVFAVLVRKLPQFEYQPGGTFRGWLRTVLLNKWRELRRRRPSPKQADAALEQLAAPAAIDSLDGKDYQKDLIQRTLALLSTDFRPNTWEAFWQTAVLGRSVRKVSAELGLSVGAIHVARCRVLQRLRHELDGQLS